MTIFAIIAITATAAVSGTALHQTVQTRFVQDWHHNASRAWSQQISIDQKLSATKYLGDEIQNIKLHMCLPCDWNVITFYVTPFLYNASEIPWDKIRRHILTTMAII